MSRPRILVFDQLYRVLAERIVEFQAEQRPRWSRVDLRVRLAYRRLGRLARRRGGGGGASRVDGGGGSGGRRYGVGLGRRRRRVSRHLGILASSRSSDYTCWLLGLHITTGQSINQSINQSERQLIQRLFRNIPRSARGE